MVLYHYYDKKIGPFKNLSELSNDEATIILSDIKNAKPTVQSAQRDSEYMFRRRMYEDIIKKEFVKKGGSIKRAVPHYMVVEHSPWLSTWFENRVVINYLCRSLRQQIALNCIIAVQFRIFVEYTINLM